MKTTLLAAAFAATFAASAQAQSSFEFMDSYAISSGVMAKSGAAYFTVRNVGDEDDTMIGATSDAAARVSLHKNIIEDGIAKMRPAEDGIAVPAGGEAVLERGGLHVMFMGLTKPFVDGETLTVELSFESGAVVELEIPIDSDFVAGEAMDHSSMDHGDMDHGDMDHDDMDHGKVDHSTMNH